MQITNGEHSASQSLVSPQWPCPLPCKELCSSHTSLRQVCKSTDSASAVPAVNPTPPLPLVRSPHLLQTLSLLLVSVPPPQHLPLHRAASSFVQCWWYNIRRALLQLEQFQFDRYWKMARARPLPEYLQVYHCTQEVHQREPLHKAKHILFTYYTDQYIWIFLTVVNSSPSKVSHLQLSLLFLHKILHCPNWKLKYSLWNQWN